MDHNLAYACVGYGVVRALSDRAPGQSFAMPAALVLREPDPVAYCIEATRAEHPDWVERIGPRTREAIRARLMDEAGRVGSLIG